MWRLNLFNFMQWEQTVYWYALSIFIIRQNALFVKGFFVENCRLTFFAKCGIPNFEGIPETVGGSLSLGESAVAISAGRRAGLFLLPLLIGTDGR